MRKLITGIGRNYAPTMTPVRGLCEFVQNYLDGLTETGQGSCTYKNGKLTLTNVGVSLEQATLLLGFSTKREDPNQIGKEGEGSKIGALALIRAGRRVVIRTGNQAWEPKIEPTKEYGGAETLVFYQRTLKSSLAETRVEIEPVSPEEWEELKSCFLQLGNKATLTGVAEFDQVALVKGVEPGLVYLGGLRVENPPPGLRCSYLIAPKAVPTDRDRRFVDAFQLQWLLAGFWDTALGKTGVLAGEALALAMEGAPDVAMLTQKPAACRKITKHFQQKFGDRAYPVETQEMAVLLGHAGINAIPAPKILCEIVHRVLGRPQELAAQLGQRFEPCSLTDKEQGTVDVITGMLANVLRKVCWDPRTLHLSCRFGTFADPNLLGCVVQNEIRISVEVVRRGPLWLMMTLVEEWAHVISGSGDGSKAHKDMLHTIWSGLWAQAMTYANTDKVLAALT